MGSSRQAMLLSLMAAVVVLLLLATESVAVTCNDVAKALGPCVKYLQNGSGLPPPPCCQGASALANSVTSTPDKQTVCNCLKSLSKNLNINLQVANSLPRNCKINFPYTIDPNVDCSRIQSTT